MFATMRRKRRSTKMKNELGQSVDHFKRAATLAAQETSATVGPKFNAARDRVQPAVSQAKGAATTSWDSAIATLAPLVTAATDNVRQTGKETKKSAKANKKRAQKKAQKNAQEAGEAREQGDGPQADRPADAASCSACALVGAAVGAGAAFVLRRRRAAQWDEYDPSAPISSAEPAGGADDAAFEPTPSPATGTSPTLASDTADQTSSALHSPNVARMASGKDKE